MNETKCIVYVPFHPIVGFDWPALTMDYDDTNEKELCEGYDWYEIIVDGDLKKKCDT